MSNHLGIKMRGFGPLKTMGVNHCQWVPAVERSTLVLHGACDGCGEIWAVLPDLGIRGFIWINGKVYEKCPHCAGEKF